MLRSRWFALVILCAATLMIILDGTIVTVALPVIQADLGFTPASLSWVMDSYLIAFGGLLLLSGRLGDLLGRKRMFLAGLAVFILASLACGLAAGPGMLIAARFVQGIGGAMASSVTLGMIVRLFSQPDEQRRAIGAFSFVGAVGASAGLIIGGLLVQLASWHWIFFVNVPIGLLAGIAGWRLLAADQGMGLRAGADALGAAAVTVGVMLGVYAIVQPSKDFALVRVDPAVPASPEMCHFGAPHGVFTSNSGGAVVLHYYGSGIGVSSVLPARSAVALGTPNPDHVFAAGVALPGDSGSGVMTADGLALGVLVSFGLHGFSYDRGPFRHYPGSPHPPQADGNGIDAGTLGITRLGPQLARASEKLGVPLELFTKQ